MHRSTSIAEVVAHRGASAHAPENTVAAFDLALAQGADRLEFDVRVTAGGALVLAHDPTLARTAGDPRAIAALTLAELDAVDAAVRPPTLDAVFARYAGATRFLVDLKDPTPAWEGEVLAAIDRHGLRSAVVVQSFDRTALERLGAVAPWLALTALFRGAEAPLAHIDAVAEWATSIGPWRGAVDAELVVAAGGLGLGVRPWTVDAPAEIERLVDLGVDGVITNAPDVAVSVVRAGALALAA